LEANTPDIWPNGDHTDLKGVKFFLNASEYTIMGLFQTKKTKNLLCRRFNLLPRSHLHIRFCVKNFTSFSGVTPQDLMIAWWEGATSFTTIEPLSCMSAPIIRSVYAHGQCQLLQEN